MVLQFFKKGFRFSENLLAKALKMFKISSDCHMSQTFQSLKQRALLKVLSTILLEEPILSVGFKIKPLKESVFLC